MSAADRLPVADLITRGIPALTDPENVALVPVSAPVKLRLVKASIYALTFDKEYYNFAPRVMVPP